MGKCLRNSISCHCGVDSSYSLYGPMKMGKNMSKSMDKIDKHIEIRSQTSINEIHIAFLFN